MSESAVPGATAENGAVIGTAAAADRGTTPVPYAVGDVKPNESLWSTAEQNLGDAQR
ncbi:hypothetical protein [Streptomyces sp. NPDC005533]|uniref:hypothetical protein n=1 Tax=Streptomyces sp. NPDC005533 TaxID=3364723 RepID=UPI0036CE7487